MYILSKSTLNGKHKHSSSDTTITAPDPNPSDPWLFTDPFARELYRNVTLLTDWKRISELM